MSKFKNFLKKAGNAVLNLGTGGGYGAITGGGNPLGKSPSEVKQQVQYGKDILGNGPAAPPPSPDSDSQAIKKYWPIAAGVAALAAVYFFIIE